MHASMYIHIYTYPLIGPPALTVNVTKNTESSSIVVQWDEVDDSLPTTYIVVWTSERDLNNIQSYTLIEQSSYTITGLTLDTVYTITVTADNRCGTGPEYSTSISLTTDTASSVNISTTPTAIDPVISTSIANPSTTTAIITFSTSTTTTTTTKVTTIGVINLNSITTPVTSPSTADTTTNTIITSTTTNHDTTTTGIVRSSSIAVMTTGINNFCTTTTNIVVSCMSTTTVANSADTTSKLSSIK